VSNDSPDKKEKLRHGAVVQIDEDGEIYDYNSAENGA